MNIDKHHIETQGGHSANPESESLSQQSGSSPLIQASMPGMSRVRESDTEVVIDKVFSLLSKSVQNCSYMEILQAVSKDFIPVSEGSFVANVTWAMVNRIPELNDTYRDLRARESWQQTVRSWFGGELASKDFLTRNEPLAGAVREMMHAGLIQLSHETNVASVIGTGISYPLVFWNIQVSKLGSSALNLVKEVV